MHHLAVVGARDSTSYTQQSLEFLLSNDKSKYLTIVSVPALLKELMQWHIK
ncbi:hypothetical protein ACVPOS_10375 [Staphylococcus aureus]